MGNVWSWACQQNIHKWKRKQKIIICRNGQRNSENEHCCFPSYPDKILGRKHFSSWVCDLLSQIQCAAFNQSYRVWISTRLQVMCPKVCYFAFQWQPVETTTSQGGCQNKIGWKVLELCLGCNNYWKLFLLFLPFHLDFYLTVKKYLVCVWGGWNIHEQWIFFFPKKSQTAKS